MKGLKYVNAVNVKGPQYNANSVINGIMVIFALR